jgi:hypothetical protein
MGKTIVAYRGLESPKADPPGDATRRNGHRALDRRAVASASSKAREEGRTLVWVDESAFYPLPAVARTWAPRGETPVLHAVLTRDHLSVMSGITPTGQLLLQMRERSLRGPDIVRFLQHLLRHIPGRLLVVWDGSPIRRAQVVKEFLAEGGAARI